MVKAIFKTRANILFDQGDEIIIDENILSKIGATNLVRTIPIDDSVKKENNGGKIK